MSKASGRRTRAVLAPIQLDARNPAPMTGRGNNTYLLVGSRSVATLIDAGVGAPGHLAEVAAILLRRRARLTQILITHAHADHASGAAALAAAYPDVRFRKHPWPEMDARYPVRFEPLADGDAVEIGGQQLQVLHTPGHSPDHLAFWHEASRTVFTGDLVVAGGSVMLDWSGGGDLGRYLASLERVLALAPGRLLPAHGACAADPAAVLQGHLDHRRMREHQVLDALNSGLDTVRGVTESIYYGLDPALVPAARENVRAHLEKLKAEGRIRERDGTWHIRWIGSSTSST
jgi:glyoxylase-like metal-dependent hydrolase (beta-lactamase superfamily II)